MLLTSHDSALCGSAEQISPVLLRGINHGDGNTAAVKAKAPAESTMEDSISAITAVKNILKRFAIPYGLIPSLSPWSLQFN